MPIILLIVMYISSSANLFISWEDRSSFHAMFPSAVSPLASQSTRTVLLYFRAYIHDVIALRPLLPWNRFSVGPSPRDKTLHILKTNPRAHFFSANGHEKASRFPLTAATSAKLVVIWQSKEGEPGRYYRHITLINNSSQKITQSIM